MGGSLRTQLSLSQRPSITALSKVPGFPKSLSLYVVYVIRTFIVTCDYPLMSVLNACVSLLKEAHDSRGHLCEESSV